MKNGFRLSSVCSAVAVAAAILAIPTKARADVTLVEKDGWTFYTRGLVAAHYQLVKGDADPDHKNLSGGSISAAGGEIKDAQAASDRSTTPPSITLSNNTNGFIDCQDNACRFSPNVTVCSGPEDNDAACSDGFSNDGDNFVDCADFDCSNNPNVTVCESEDNDAACSDGISNDGDNFVDCDDFDCSNNPNVTVCP